MTSSADFFHQHDVRRGAAVRLPHKTGAALQVMPGRFAFAILPSLIGAAALIAIALVVVGAVAGG